MPIVDSLFNICIIHGMRRTVFLITAIFLACGQSPEARAKMILNAGLEDDSPVVRISAARGLSRAGDMRGIELLQEMLTNNDPMVQSLALESLLEHGQSTIDLSVIAGLCRSTDASVRETAYRFVAVTDDTSAKDILIQGTSDGSAKVRGIAFKGLGKNKANDLVQSGLQDPDPLVRIAAAQTLGESGAGGMAEFIKEELKKLAPNTLGAGVIAFAELGDTAALPLLRTLLQESAGELRVDIAEALLIMYDTMAIDALRAAFRSNDPFVRMHAVAVLKRHDVPGLNAELVAAAHDEYTNVALEAVQVLAERDGENQRELFVELMDAQNPLLRIAGAAAFLGSRDGP